MQVTQVRRGLLGALLLELLDDLKGRLVGFRGLLDCWDSERPPCVAVRIID